MESQSHCKIFYSWQSDLSFDTNQKAIGTCIKSAIVKIEERNQNLKLLFDEATRGETGSPEIPVTIFKKISVADIFICDITTINTGENTTRKMPNPNVLVELGYAIATLGWERIIMVFNGKYGDFNLELPFDLEKRRVTAFSITGGDDKSGKGDLQVKLTKGIESIAQKNDSIPFNCRVKKDEDNKREKDVVSLNLLMSCIHIETMDSFIEELPDKVLSRILYYLHEFNKIYEKSNFYIFNPGLSFIVKRFHKVWNDTLNHGGCYYNAGIKDFFSFIDDGDFFSNEKTENEYREIEKEAVWLKALFRDLIVFIKENFVEVDLDRLSEKALKKYIEKEGDL